MAPPKPRPRDDRLRLVAAGEGVLRVVRTERTFRFLLAGGATIDVVTDRDDSDVRSAVLAHTGAERIEGVAELADQGTLIP
jgi:hypothetical protein